jgi:hypothetical protein
MANVVRFFYGEMGIAWRVLFALTIPMSIVWFIARHAMYWMFLVFYGLFGPQDARHFGTAPPESNIAGAEAILAFVAAYAVGALFMQNGLIWNGVRKIGQSENFSPTAIFLLAGKFIGGWVF